MAIHVGTEDSGQCDMGRVRCAVHVSSEGHYRCVGDLHRKSFVRISFTVASFNTTTTRLPCSGRGAPKLNPVAALTVRLVSIRTWHILVSSWSEIERSSY